MTAYLGKLFFNCVSKAEIKRVLHTENELVPKGKPCAFRKAVPAEDDTDGMQQGY